MKWMIVLAAAVCGAAIGCDDQKGSHSQTAAQTQPQTEVPDIEQFRSMANKWCQGKARDAQDFWDRAETRDHTGSHYNCECQVTGVDILKTNSIAWPIQGVIKASETRFRSGTNTSSVYSENITVALGYRHGKWRGVGGTTKVTMDTSAPETKSSDVGQERAISAGLIDIFIPKELLGD